MIRCWRRGVSVLAREDPLSDNNTPHQENLIDMVHFRECANEYPRRLHKRQTVCFGTLRFSLCVLNGFEDDVRPYLYGRPLVDCRAEFACFLQQLFSFLPLDQQVGLSVPVRGIIVCRIPKFEKVQREVRCVLSPR